MSGSRPSLPSIPLQNRKLGPGKRTGPFLFLIFHIGRHSRCTVIFSNIYVRTKKYSTLSVSATISDMQVCKMWGFRRGDPGLGPLLSPPTLKEIDHRIQKDHLCQPETSTVIIQNFIAKPRLWEPSFHLSTHANRRK
jgi:hypothetical protein